MKNGVSVVALILLGVLSTALSGCGTPELGTEDNPIVMAIVSSGDTQESIAASDQLAQMITNETGLIVEATVATDFAAVREAMGMGTAHIGWLDTFNYLLANEEYDVDVGLVTERYGSTTYQCQLNVRADSEFTTLEDLRGKVMCWLEPDSTLGYTIPRIMLQANGIDPDSHFAQMLEASSHNDVITAVYNGHCDVGASYADARSSIEADYPDVKDVVMVLATSAEIPKDSVSFTEDFPAEAREQIVNALLEISATEEGRAALEALYSVSALIKVDDSIYDGFRTDLSKADIEIESLVE